MSAPGLSQATIAFAIMVIGIDLAIVRAAFIDHLPPRSAGPGGRLLPHMLHTRMTPDFTARIGGHTDQGASRLLTLTRILIMIDHSSVVLRPSRRSFFLWCVILLGFLVGLCAVYHAVWPLSHPVPDGELVEYIEYSALACAIFALFLLLLFIVPAAIIYVIRRGRWEARAEGLAMFRGDRLIREVPWSEVTAIRTRLLGVRVHVKYRVEGFMILWVPWRETRAFARLCRERIGPGPASAIRSRAGESSA